jgi:2-oxoglutarate/2-oxoacid ferredoxin oxidoreductase subunit alpha
VDSFTTLIGGKAGDGIVEAGQLVTRVLGRFGYRLYTHADFPSLIRGGHNWVIVRAKRERIHAIRDDVDVLLALNEETIDRHFQRLKPESITIFDANAVKLAKVARQAPGHRIGVPLKSILAEEGAPPVMRNTCLLGAYCRAIGIPWSILEDILTRYVPKQVELNLKVARRGYDASREIRLLDLRDQPPLPVMSGNEAVGLGLLRAGLGAYCAYPMSPSSSLLHFLAREEERFGVKVVQPEGEIAAVMMALGFAYAGVRAAVGTSGGGFCLMTEALSFAAQAELPLVVMIAQRPGPSTGLPTYTAQTELHFALAAGQGEFPRLIVAPSDADEAYSWSAVALEAAWKYQVPALVLSDKMVSENVTSFEKIEPPKLAEWDDEAFAPLRQVKRGRPLSWKPRGEHVDDKALRKMTAAGWPAGGGAAGGETSDWAEPLLRYRLTVSGVSPFAAPPIPGEVVKANSYTHDELGITTEDPTITVDMQDKWSRKAKAMAREFDHLPTVSVAGDPDADTAILCWGSSKGACLEAADLLGDLRVVTPVVLEPFPKKQLARALAGAERVIAVECSPSGQMARLARRHGFAVHDLVQRYDGRPFSVGDLEWRLQEVLS